MLLSNYDIGGIKLPSSGGLSHSAKIGVAIGAAVAGILLISAPSPPAPFLRPPRPRGQHHVIGNQNARETTDACRPVLGSSPPPARPTALVLRTERCHDRVAATLELWRSTHQHPPKSELQLPACRFVTCSTSQYTCLSALCPEPRPVSSRDHSGGHLVIRAESLGALFKSSGIYLY